MEKEKYVHRVSTENKSKRRKVILELPPSIDGNANADGLPSLKQSGLVDADAACSFVNIGEPKISKKGHGSANYSALLEELNLMLNQLGYLGGKDSEIIYTAIEQQNKEWEVVFKDLARMEGLLARKDLKVRDPHLLASSRKAITNYQKVSGKFLPVMDLVIAIERVGMQGQFMCDRFDKSIENREEISEDGNLIFPLLQQYRKIFNEVMRRTSAWTDELNRRIDELGKIF